MSRPDMPQADDRGSRSYLIWLALLVTVRVVVVVLPTYLDVPHIDYRTGWYYGHGGDEISYFSAVKALLDGRAYPTSLPPGLILVLAPIALFTRASSWTDVVSIAAPLTALAAGVASVLLVARIGRRLFGETPAIIAAGLWAAFPFIHWYLGRAPFIDATQGVDVRSIEFTALAWLQVTHTQYAILFMLCFVAVMVGGSPSGARRAAVTGALLGLTALTRVELGVLLIPLSVWYGSRKQFRNLVVATAAAAVTYSVQLVFNHVLYGSPMRYGYVAHRAEDQGPIFSVTYLGPLFEQFVQHYRLFVPALALAAIGTLVAWRRSKPAAALATSWLLVTAGVYLLFHASRFAPLVRMSVALAPLLLLIGVALHAAWGIRRLRLPRSAAAILPLTALLLVGGCAPNGTGTLVTEARDGGRPVSFYYGLDPERTYRLSVTSESSDSARLLLEEGRSTLVDDVFTRQLWEPRVSDEVPLPYSIMIEPEPGTFAWGIAVNVLSDSEASVTVTLSALEDDPSAGPIPAARGVADPAAPPRR